MKNIWLVTAAGVKNSLRLKAALIILILITLICVGGVMLILCLLLVKPEVESAAPDTATLKEYLALMLYSSSLISIGVTLNSMMFQTMVKEKARGVLAALLATPLRASDIWLGKSLALFVPGLVLSIVLTVLSLVIINAIYFMPDIGFLSSPQMIVTSLAAVPLVYLFFGMLVHLVGLISKPATGNVIAQIFLPVIANLMIQLCVQGVMGADSWLFMASNFGLALVIGIVVLIIKPRLTPERVILSG